MPRCYMVKKSKQWHDGPPLYSPTEATVAPPCYNPVETSAVVQGSQPEHDSVLFLERTAADTQAALDLLSLANSRPIRPQSPQSPPPSNSPQAPAPPEPPHSPPQLTPAPQHYVIESLAPEPFAPEPFVPESIIPQTFAAETYIPDTYIPEPGYITEHFAQEPFVTEQFTPLVQPDPPLLPVYTYTLQPTNIFIVTDDHTEPVYPTRPNVTPVQQFEYMVDPQVYVMDPNLVYQPVTQDAQIQFVEPLTIPIIVETVPMSVPQVAPTTSPPPPPAPPQPAEIPVQLPAAMPVPVPVPTPATAPQVVAPSQAPSQPPPIINTNSVIEPGEIRQPTSKDKNSKYDCDECGKSYATSSNLSRHKQTHRSLDSGAAKKCEECGKAYVSMPALAMHVLTHKMGYTCKVCGKNFSRPWLLRGHSRSHTGERPYDCPVAGCRKAFGDRSNLRAHLQTHSPIKEYECCRCEKQFALKSYLIKHQESACYQPC